MAVQTVAEARQHPQDKHGQDKHAHIFTCTDSSERSVVVAKWKASIASDDGVGSRVHLGG